MNGKIIAQLRNKHNLTQKELADRLFVSRQLVSMWENDLRRPDYNSLKKISDMFDIDIDEIFMPYKDVLEELTDCADNNVDISLPDLSKIINEFLSKLSKKERFIFIKRYYFFESFSEIAFELGIKENHARSILSRVRKKLAKHISEVNYDKQ